MRNVVVKWLACAALLLGALAGRALAAPTSQRPIEDFVNAQGTYCIPPQYYPTCNVEPPIGNLVAWQRWIDGYRRFARVDFVGLVDRYLEANGMPTFGTSIMGSITERPLPDGTAQVSVRLHATHAPAWVTYRKWIDLNGDGVGTGNELSGPTLKAWGNGAAALAAGAAPSLGDVEFKIVFINPSMGAPMPDLYRFYFDPVYAAAKLYMSIAAQGIGELGGDAATIGLGDPGAPADLLIHQVGLLEVFASLPETAGQPGMHEGIFNNGGWPVELLEIKPIP